jgi:hypothetical protein
VVITLLYGGTAYLRGDSVVAAVAITAVVLNVLHLLKQHGYNQLLARRESR